MKRDILVILACLSVGFAMIGCGMSELTRMFFVEDVVLPVFDVATDAAIETILPKANGEFKGIKLGMTRDEVKSVIEKEKSLTPVESSLESSLEGIDQAKTVMWGSEIWIRLFYDEERLYQIWFGTEKVSEDLIETKLCKQFTNLYWYFYRGRGDPDYCREGSSTKKITVSSFEEDPVTIIFYWLNKNTKRAIVLWKGDSKYCSFASISIPKELLKEKE